ncbi:hypothetical protein DRO97_05395 [Archaeoglobales archaeon]|nr:MAG: hypothetical protein DRO97_05395 [Archaeoglobales archaeon]
MTDLWLRYVDLTVNNLNFNSDNFDIEFEVEKKEDEAKTAIITIYNISQQTREKIKKDDTVELKAGYKEDCGTIFYGKVVNVDFELKGADEATIIECTDATAELGKQLLIVSYPKDTDTAKVVRDLCNYSNIPIGRIDDTGFKFEKSYTFQGTPAEIIEDIIKFCNGKLRQELQNAPYLRKMLSSVEFGREYVFTIENNMAYFVRGAKIIYETEVLESDTGLLEVSKIKSEDKDKFKIRALLRWRIQVGKPVVIKSVKLDGQFNVSAYRHVCKGEEYYTELEVIP